MPSLLSSARYYAGLLLLLAGCSGNEAAAPTVAVSITPLEHLVAELMDGVGRPQLVVRAGQDPHHISLRPSERRVLDEAALLVWVGPALELPLAGIVPQLPGTVLTLQQLDGLNILPGGSTTDPHLWLDSSNARRIAEVTAAELARLDPAHAQRYAANLARLDAQLQASHTTLQQRFAEQGAAPWAVYHHAFRYVEAEYGLPPALQLRDSDNAEAGLRSVLAFREALAAEQLDCLVAEPQMNPGELTALVDDASLRVARADVLGLDLPVQPGSFVALLTQVSEAILSCRGAAHD